MYSLEYNDSVMYNSLASRHSGSQFNKRDRVFGPPRVRPTQHNFFSFLCNVFTVVSLSLKIVPLSSNKFYYMNEKEAFYGCGRHDSIVGCWWLGVYLLHDPAFDTEGLMAAIQEKNEHEHRSLLFSLAQFFIFLCSVQIEDRQNSTALYLTPQND